MDGDKQAPSTKRRQPPDNAKKGKQARSGEGPCAEGRGEAANADLMAEVRELKGDLQAMRRKVAHESDIGRVEERVRCLEEKVEYIAHTVHQLHCLMTMDRGNASSQYMSGY